MHNICIYGLTTLGGGGGSRDERHVLSSRERMLVILWLLIWLDESKANTQLF